jgi:hypothetical protein
MLLYPVFLVCDCSLALVYVVFCFLAAFLSPIASADRWFY